MDPHHYVGFRGFVGERIYQVAEWQGRGVALIGWTAAAYRCRARDRWIGWTDDQRRRRLRFVANNARFLILPDAHVPHLGSRVLGLAMRRLSSDWQAIHGHPVVLAETVMTRPASAEPSIGPPIGKTWAQPWDLDATMAPISGMARSNGWRSAVSFRLLGRGSRRRGMWQLSSQEVLQSCYPRNP